MFAAGTDRGLSAVCSWRAMLICISISQLASPSQAVPLLPDLVSYASEELEYMYGGEFDLSDTPGRVFYRFDVAIANFGEGPFQVLHETDLAAETQDIYQQVFDSAGGLTTTLMGTFDYQDPPFGRMALASLARYNLREVTADEGVGPVVATFDKTSHAVVDSTAIDLSLPGAPPTPAYRSGFANPLGVSIGYADLYGRTIPEQRIDVTGVPSGQYWLEVVIDPLEYVQETDDTNNTTRILVDLDIPTTGDYDGDFDVDGADFRAWQRGESPNALASGDFSSWTANYGTTYPPLASSSVALIPEPTTALLLVAACVLATTPRRNARQYSPI